MMEKEDKMYKLPNLPYLYQDLEPYIDTHTMALHHEKHEQNYLNNLNKLLNKNNYNYTYKLEELIYHLNEFLPTSREEILFNLGGVLNHELYWKSMNPYHQNKPEGKLKEKIDRTFGSYKNFWEAIKEKGLNLKGSGYVFLIFKDNELDIINTKNQDTPLSFGYIPLFNIDLWEHAYYINYENYKEKYLDNFEKIADFTYANEVYNRLTSAI